MNNQMTEKVNEAVLAFQNKVVDLIIANRQGLFDEFGDVGADLVIAKCFERTLGQALANLIVHSGAVKEEVLYQSGECVRMEAGEMLSLILENLKPNDRNKPGCIDLTEKAKARRGNGSSSHH